MEIVFRQPDTTHLNSNYRAMDGMWKCDVCSAVFQRLDHFKRHSGTHKTEKPFMCNFCGSLYKRGDVLRRHWKSCPLRIQAGQPVPEPRPGGKEKHACDGCARLKRSCTGGQPCSECYSRGRRCSYQRLGSLRSTTTTSATTTSTGSPLREWGGSAPGPDLGLIELQDNRDLQRQPDSERSTWDLGPQTFYPSSDVCYQAYSRRP